MRKRRVLALLLALSLVVSGNGMTVLAAEQGADMSVLAAEETTDETPVETEDTSGDEDETPETEDKEDKAEEKEPETEGDGSSEEDKGDEGETPENPENPENPDESDPSAPKEDDAEQGNDQPADENGDQSGNEDGDQSSVEDGEQTEEQGPAEDAQEPSVSENDLDETETPEEEIGEKPAEVRMMSFTDASGLRITFDAVAAEANAEKATITEDGVLTGIDDSVEGVVDLRKENITKIGDGAFRGKIKVTYVMLPKTVVEIGSESFFGCGALKGISIPSRLTKIGDGAFQNCTNLTQLAIPNSVSSIGASAFQDDKRLFMVNMASADYSKLETIGASAFENCYALEFFCSDDDYELPDSLKTIGASAFKGCRTIDEVDMGDGITSLGESAYQGCTGIREVEISARLTTIPTKAFADCTGLIVLEFNTGVRGIYTSIETLAFENCTALVSVELPQSVTSVKAHAFKGCAALQRIYVKFDNALLEDWAFPNENEGLCILGSGGSAAYDYAKRNGNLRFIAIDEKNRRDYYTYTQNIDDSTGQIKVSVTKEISASAQDINSITNKDGVAPYNKGVKAGTECFVMINWGAGNENKIRLVPDSLRCNGEKIDYDKNRRVYCFEMPNGGAAITAKFEWISAGNAVDGDDSTIEGRLSADVNYDFGENVAYMQEGQSAKFYLTNSVGEMTTRIPASKITYRVSANSQKGVVSVDAEGEIKALKAGSAIVEAEVKTKNGKTVVKNVHITVRKAADIDRIQIRLDENKYTGLTVEKDGDEINGVSLSTDTVTGKAYEIDIEANAFSAEDDEEMKTAFTWTSSDTKVARLKKASTPSGASENKITIPMGADGEATITITAKDAKQRKTTKKFVVSVQNYAPRLTASTVTVNLKQENGATTIGIIDAYGHEVVNGDSKKPVLAYVGGKEVPQFTFEFVSKDDARGVSTYKINIHGATQKTYDVKLGVYVMEGVSPKLYETPLKIVVKESEPAPTVSFDKKAEKINLFLANDGVEIKPVIGKLGDNVVSKYKLAPLTEKGDKNHNEDNLLFIDNFQIDEDSGVITQKASNLKKNNKGKPVLTGYLVLTFEGYVDLEKKYKITIPTTTVAPAYVLDRTTDTFGSEFKQKQNVTLQLLDKKTKKPIVWDEGFENGLTIDTDATTVGLAEAKMIPVEQKVDGKSQKCVGIQVGIPTAAKTSGKLVMKVRNRKWAEDREFKFTYNIKIDTQPHKLSLKKATVTLNANYHEREEAFTLVSNHKDVDIIDTQKFEPQSTAKNAAEYQKLDVVCENGEGRVSLKADGKDIKAGSYKFVYKYNRDGKENKVTLTVKVNRAVPTVTLKGSNAFNLTAKDGEKYVEVSEMTMAVKNLPNTEKYLESADSENPDQPGGGNGGENPDQPGSGSGGENPDQPGSGSGGENPDQPGSGSGGENPDQPGGGNGGENTDQPESGDAGNGGTNEGGEQMPPTTQAMAAQTEPQRKINGEFYRLNTAATFDSIMITTKNYESKAKEYFEFGWSEDENGAGGKLTIRLKKAMDAKTYTLKMTPTYSNEKNTIEAKAVSFKIKVYRNVISTVRLSAKGKINLLDRRPVNVSENDFEYTEKNGIRYTPTITNLKDTLKEVRLFEDYPSISDYADDSKLSTRFEAKITEDKKSFYIVPKEGVELKNKETYKVYAWLLMDGYKFSADTGNGIYTQTPIKVKTAEILPKVKTDQTTANLYLSSKAYEATFIVQKSDEKAIGAIENIAFGEKDEKANESFEVYGVKKPDGSLEVHLKLKNGVSYGCNSTNKIKMYIQFTGQGTNTAGTPITMNVKINK